MPCITTSHPYYQAAFSTPPQDCLRKDGILPRPSSSAFAYPSWAPATSVEWYSVEGGQHHRLVLAVLGESCGGVSRVVRDGGR